MERAFCDLCEKEITDHALSSQHWCGNFTIENIRAEVELSFNGSLCYACRERFEGELLSRTTLESWVPSYIP